MTKVASWVNEIVEQASRAPGEKKQKKDGRCQDQAVVAPVADNGSSGMRGLRDATTVAEFVPPLLALLPPVVTGLLTTFNPCEPEQELASGGGSGKCQDEKNPLKGEEALHDDSKYQDGVVLQALQGTEVYQEITKIERDGDDGGRPRRVASVDGISTDAAVAVTVGRGGDGGGEKGPGSSGAKGGGADAQAPSSSQQAAAAAAAAAAVAPAPFPSTGPSTPSPSSSSSFWAEEHGCGCSSRHVVTIMTYAFLLLLHKRDHEGSCGAGAGADADADAGPSDAEGGGDGGDLPEPLWRKDPLRLLPAPVADEARHVAGMLRGLVEMEICEKCRQS